jgi:hypothetical protein
MTKPRVDIGKYGIWYGMIDALPTPEAQRAAQVVEELGFGALWVAEAVGRDPFVSASGAAVRHQGPGRGHRHRQHLCP